MQLHYFSQIKTITRLLADVIHRHLNDIRLLLPEVSLQIVQCQLEIKDVLTHSGFLRRALETIRTPSASFNFTAISRVPLLR